MFSIILKLKYHTWKKLQNYFSIFGGKKWDPNQWFCSRVNKWLPTYLGFGDFKFPKNCSSQ